jgi:hypothetical protein
MHIHDLICNIDCFVFSHCDLSNQLLFSKIHITIAVPRCCPARFNFKTGLVLAVTLTFGRSYGYNTYMTQINYMSQLTLYDGTREYRYSDIISPLQFLPKNENITCL